MTRILCCIAIFCLLSTAGHCQSDTLRLLMEQINRVTLGELPSCKKTADFKKSIREIEHTSFNVTVSKFLAADSIYVKNNKDTACPLRNLLVQAKQLLINTSAASDSATIVAALMYLKNEFTGLRSIKLRTVQSREDIGDAFVNIHSIEPVISMPGNKTDGVYSELFLVPGKAYSLRLSASGYEVFTQELKAPLQDTVLEISLKKIVDASVEEPEPPEVKPSPKIPYFWWILAGIFLLVLGALVWKLLSSSKLRRQESEREVLQEEIIKQKELITEQAKEMYQLQQKVHSSTALPILPTVNSQSSLPMENSSYFLTEVMMTAGPRKPKNKGNSDPDLGEDVCGFMISQDEAICWLLDGTSDEECLRVPSTGQEYFSSRMLAQSIGRKLKTFFTRAGNFPMDQVMQQIMEEVKQDWMQTLKTIGPEETRVLLKNVADKYFPQCSATIIVADLFLNGDLTVYRTGDSKLFVYTHAPQGKKFINTVIAGKTAESFHRFYFRIVKGNDGQLDIVYNKPLFEVIHEAGVAAIVAFSDGIGSVTEERLRRDYPSNPETVRQEMISDHQGTGDDKSIFIVEIKQ